MPIIGCKCQCILNTTKTNIEIIIIKCHNHNDMHDTKQLAVSWQGNMKRICCKYLISNELHNQVNNHS